MADGLEGVWVLNELELGFWTGTDGWLRVEMMAGGLGVFVGLCVCVCARLCV